MANTIVKQGNEIGTFEKWSELRVGKSKPLMIYKGNEIVYPNPIKDGLVLWYDFAGMRNTDSNREIAKDLSDNGNHGELRNFGYTAESGYVGDGLKFDGVDDSVILNLSEKQIDASNMSISTTLNFSEISTTTQWAIHFLLESGKYFLIFKSSDNAGNKIGYYSTDSINNYSNYIPTANKSFGISLNITNKKVRVVVNGNLEDEIEDVGLGKVRRIRISHSPRYKGVVHSLKIHDRPLTPEEIAHNYAIEKERFGIE